MRQAAASALLILAACQAPAPEPKASEQPAKSPSSTSPLVGSWTADGPVRLIGEDVRTETGEAQVEYRPDGSFHYRARLSMAGGKMPTEGLSFRLEATGRWQLAEAVLTERFEAVIVEPEEKGQANLNLIAEALGDEMKAEEPSRAEVVELTRDRLVLRERESAQVVTYVRNKR